MGAFFMCLSDRQTMPPDQIYDSVFFFLKMISFENT